HDRQVRHLSRPAVRRAARRVIHRVVEASMGADLRPGTQPEPAIGDVKLDDVRAARELLSTVVNPTPLETSRWLGDRVGGPAYLKCENLQRTGSFKLRGAYVRIARLSHEQRAAGVVAASAGNHAQGVALAASLLGIKATVFMPEGAPIPKERATRGYGADVRFAGTSIDEALVTARAF